jgi:hypothetical protein
MSEKTCEKCGAKRYAGDGGSLKLCGNCLTKQNEEIEKKKREEQAKNKPH